MLGYLDPATVSKTDRMIFAKLLMIETLMGQHQPLQFLGLWGNNRSFKSASTGIAFDQLIPWYKGDYEYMLYALIKDIFEYGAVELEKMIHRKEIDLCQATNIQERDFQNAIPQYLITETSDEIALYAFDRSL